MKVDLHIHTKYSDGGKSVQEIFDTAHKNGVGILSITDHNTIEAYKEIKNVNTHDIHVINGIEIDVLTNEKTVIHVLMYDFDLNTFLQEYLKKSHEYDIKEFLRMIQDCKNLFCLNFDNYKVENFIKKNEYFDKVRLNDFFVELNLVASPKEAFYKYTKNIKDKTRYAITEKQLFLLAKNCNGKTFVAHPMKYIKDYNTIENIQKMILRLKEQGLNGIEVFNNRQDQDQEFLFLNFAKDNNFLISAGSDHHAKYGTIENKEIGKVLGKDILSTFVSKQLLDKALN